MSAAPAVVLLLASLFFTPFAAAQSDDYQEAAKLFRSGQHAQALERVDNFLKANPKEARARFLKGLIFTEQSKPADAIKIFTSLTEDYPELPEPYNNLAVLYASQGQYDKARNALEMAIRTHPSYATAHENLGDIYAKMASQAYDKALQIDKTNSAAQTKLGLIKELFTGGTRGTKQPASKTDSNPKSTVVAVAKPAPAPQVAAPAAAPSAAPPAAQPAPQPRAEPPKPAEPAKTAKPEPAKPAVPDASSEVIRAVNNWAKAWSDKDVSAYLGFYAPEFKPPGGEPRSDWEAERKLRISKPKKIEVQVESPQVKFTDKNRAAVTFRQSYRSSSLKAMSTKTLVMMKAGDRWLIQQERVGS